jgi:dolichol-phosphate mannosyltransferase
MSAEHKLSVAVPLFNEEAVVTELYGRLKGALDELPCDSEMVFVLDGCNDNTLKALLEVAGDDPRLLVVEFSRNFGLQAAVQACVDIAEGDALVVIDGDLQDPPELIPELYQRWRQGADVVLTRKRSRAEKLHRRVMFYLFYAIQKRLVKTDMLAQAGNFSLLGQKALAAIRGMPEHNRYFPGLRAWVGFDADVVEYDRAERAAGRPTMTWGKLFRLGFDGLFGFTDIPLKISTLFGTLAGFVGVLLIINVLIQKFIWHTAIPGWTSTIIAICLLGGAQLITIGILGNYVHRVFDEVRRRPHYLVKRKFRPARPVEGMDQRMES